MDDHVKTQKYTENWKKKHHPLYQKRTFLSGQIYILREPVVDIVDVVNVIWNTERCPLFVELCGYQIWNDQDRKIEIKQSERRTLVQSDMFKPKPEGSG